MYRRLMRNCSAIEDNNRSNYANEPFDANENQTCIMRPLAPGECIRVIKNVQSFDQTVNGTVHSRPPQKASRCCDGKSHTIIATEFDDRADSLVSTNATKNAKNNEQCGDGGLTSRGCHAMQKKFPLINVSGSVGFADGETIVTKVLEQTERINKRQRLIAQATFFEIEKDAQRNGLQILLSLFAEHPQYKNIWPQFRAIPDSALMSAQELRKHSQIYMEGLRTIINSLDDNERLAAVLKRIAKAHVKWNVHKFHLMHMAEPIIEKAQCKAGNQFKAPEVADAWTTLYDVIANLIDIYRALEGRGDVREH